MNFHLLLHSSALTNTKMVLTFLLLQSLLKQQSELSSKWEGAVAHYKAEIATLQSKIEELSELVQKQKSELDGVRLKDEAKAEQLKHIEEMTVGIPENMSKMTIDDIKDRFRSIHQWSTPGYLPPPEPETVAPPKKPISTSSGSKTATGKRERRSSGPETSEQKGVTLRRTAIPPNKSTSMSRKK